MRIRLFFMLLLVMSFTIVSPAQDQSGKIVFIKNSMSKITSKNAKIEKIAGGFQFTEGPVWHKDGYLLFSDIPANKIYKYEPGKDISIYLENSGYVGSEESNEGRGSNGLTFDKHGNLIICQHGARQVVKADRAGNFIPLARQYKGKRLNSPNDVVVRSDGSIYFTDPPWGLPGLDKDPTKELDLQGIYKLVNGNLELFDGELSRPNGIAFSPDEKYLYVSNLDGKRKEYYRYTLDENGNAMKKELFFDATDLEGKGGPDGIKIDKKGNCYFTGPGGILLLNPKAELLGIISPPEIPANIAWGGKDGKTLFMTCRTGLYAVKLKIEGVGSFK